MCGIVLCRSQVRGMAVGMMLEETPTLTRNSKRRLILWLEKPPALIQNVFFCPGFNSWFKILVPFIMKLNPAAKIGELPQATQHGSLPKIPKGAGRFAP